MFLPRAALGPSSLEVFLEVPDIQWPLRVWSHPCGSCLGGEGWNKTDLVFSSFLNHPLMRTAFPWEMKPVQHSAFLV